MKIFLERGISHLDLHGTKHSDVHNEILDFTYRYQDQLPLIIICGNSNEMIKIVSNELERNSFNYSSPRFGIIRVERI